MATSTHVTAPSALACSGQGSCSHSPFSMKTEPKQNRIGSRELPLAFLVWESRGEERKSVPYQGLPFGHSEFLPSYLKFNIPFSALLFGPECETFFPARAKAPLGAVEWRQCVTMVMDSRTDNGCSVCSDICHRVLTCFPKLNYFTYLLF